MKLGWNEEDQPYDDDLIIWTPLSPVPTADPPSSSSSITSTRDSSLSSSNSDTDQELMWDSSPEQLQLSISDSNLQLSRSPNHERKPTFQRTRYFRRNATSGHQLSRSDAFRINARTESSHHVPTKSLSDETQTLRRPSRIPKPQYHSEVNLEQVNDISDLPAVTLSTPNGMKPPIQQDLAPSKQPSHSLTNRPRRQTQQPLDYRQFHNSGQRRPNEEKR